MDTESDAALEELRKILLSVNFNKTFSKHNENDDGRKSTYKQDSQRKVLEQLAEMIDATENPEEDGDPGGTSLMHEILVNKLTIDLLEQGCEDEEQILKTAQKVATFVEILLKESYDRMGRRYGDDFKAKIPDSSVEVSSDEEYNELDKKGKGERYSDAVDLSESDSDIETDVPTEGKHIINIEKIPEDSVMAIQSSGTIIHLRRDDGTEVQVEDAKLGDKEATVVRKEIVNKNNPLLKEWSTWLVEVVDKTKDWANWIDDTVSKAEVTVREAKVKGQSKERLRQISSEWKSFVDVKNKESIVWRKRKSEISSKAKYWKEKNLSMHSDSSDAPERRHQRKCHASYPQKGNQMMANNIRPNVQNNNPWRWWYPPRNIISEQNGAVPKEVHLHFRSHQRPYYNHTYPVLSPPPAQEPKYGYYRR